jgi:UDP-glucose 4-epimerase
VKLIFKGDATVMGEKRLMKCVVTGGAGFAGSKISQKLLEDGHEVTVYDNLSVGKKENVPEGARLIEGDILEKDMLCAALRGADMVFHEAAFVSIRNSFLEPRREFETNVIGTINLLDAMVANDVSKIVFASSMAVYGIPKKGIASENDIVQPISPYGLSKLKGEMLCKIYSERYGIAYNILRYFNIFGEGQRYSEYVGVLTAFIHQALLRTPITVCGNGQQERDFVFVDDVVKANILSVGHLKNRIFNIGSGTKTSIIALAKAVSSAFNENSIEYIAKPFGEIETICADITAASGELDYSPSCNILQYVPKLCDIYKAEKRT